MARKVKISPSNAAPWHPGYPFRPGGGKKRTVISWACLGVLAGLIGAYAYATDGNRVKRLAEESLSDALGGVVHVGRARLSIFEGLRLDDVTISADNGPEEDCRLVTAQSVYVSLPWLHMARGDLSKTQIVMVEPHVYAASGGERGWNFLRLHPRQPRGEKQEPWFKLSLPEFKLREAKITYSEWEKGKLEERDTVAVEGHAGLAGAGDVDAGKYVVALKARNSGDRPGFTLAGTLDPSNGQIGGRLMDFDVGAYEGMLPAGVRKWWVRHGVTGKIELPELTFDPASQKFNVVAKFDGGSLSFRPEELTTTKLQPGLPAIRFSDAKGEMAFDEAGVHLRDMSLVHEGNVIRVSGGFQGYDENSPFSFTVACDKLHLAEHPVLVPSLPPDAREIYDRFLPSGDGAFKFEIARNADGGFSVNGRLDILDGQMAFELFPYRCYGLTGALIVKCVRPDQTRLELADLRGHGKPGTPNEKADIRVDGWVFPLEHGSGIDVSVSGKGVTGDEALVRSMPPKVREALKVFALKGREAPEFAGDFAVRVRRDQGEADHWDWPIDIHVKSGTGAFEGFPYPLENVHGDVRVGHDFVRLNDVRSSRGGATLVVDGTCSYGDDVPDGKMRYDVGIEARHVPIDDALVGAIPEEKRGWVTKLGLAGAVDLSGKITGLDARYDLGISLANGTMRPNSGQWVATDVNAEVRLTPDELEIERVLAKRGEGRIEAKGNAVWPKGDVAVKVEAKAHTLPLDAELRSMLPDDGRAAWDAVRPEGAADVNLTFTDGPLKVEISPLGATMTPSILPVKLTDVRGKIAIDDEKVTLTGLSATHGGARVALGGTGSTRAAGQWDMVMSATDLTLDDELRAALPSMLKSSIEGMDVKGKADVDVRRLRFTPGAGEGAAAKGAEATFDVSLAPVDLNLSLGVPVHLAAGNVRLAGAVHNDRLEQLDGDVALKNATIAGRPLTSFAATVAKKQGDPILRVNDIGGILADGQLAGSARIGLPDVGSTSYVLALQLRDADVRQLAGKQGEELSGRMSASLNLSGLVDDPSTRKGSGDISVVGDHMAKIPVLLGIVQVANLSIPNRSFNSATAKYAMDGGKIDFDQLTIRAPNLEMNGRGNIDLNDRTFKLTFFIAPPDLPKIPVWSDFTDRVRNELLKFEFSGEIDNPHVSARSFDSFTTTVKEVFEQKGSKPKK